MSGKATPAAGAAQPTGAAAAAPAAGDVKQGDQATGAAAAAGGGAGDQATGEAGKGGAQGAAAGTESGKPAAEGTGGESGKEGTGDGKPKAPATYTWNIPDEAKPFVHPKLLERVEAVARANDWSDVEANAEIADAIALDQQIRTDRIATFEAETKADADFGGDKLTETQRLANLAIDKVFPQGHRLREGFMSDLKATGYGSKLSVVAFLATIGRMVAEDQPPGSASGERQGARAEGEIDADKFYTHPTSKALAGTK